jgi:hypothetical protein
LIQREGCIEEQGVYKEFKAIIDQGVPVSMPASTIVCVTSTDLQTTLCQIPTNRQWREIQIAQATDPTDTKRNRLGADQIMLNGKLMQHREYLGVKVLLPV